MQKLCVKKYVFIQRRMYYIYNMMIDRSRIINIDVYVNCDCSPAIRNVDCCAQRIAKPRTRGHFACCEVARRSPHARESKPFT